MLQNPRVTYKARLLDYDALLALSDDECCFSLSEREVAMLLVLVDYIGWQTRYIATETGIDTNLIQRWADNLARKLMSGCCPDEGQHRFTEQGVFQTSNDGGETWFDDPENDPRNDFFEAPPLPGAPSLAKKCAAADNVRGLFEQYRDNLVEIVDATPQVLEIIAFILSLLAALAGATGIGVGLSVVFLAMAAQIIQIGGVGIVAEITFTALETFKCLVYCRMNDDGELTYDAWQGLLADIAAEFSGFAETFFYQTVMGMGYIGVNNAATMGASTASDCGDCDCTVDCVDFPITQGSIASISGSTVVYDSEFDPGTGRSIVTLDNQVISGGDGQCCFVNVCTIAGASVIFFTVDCGASEGGFHTPQGECVVAFSIWNTSAIPFTVTIEWGGHCP